MDAKGTVTWEGDMARGVGTVTGGEEGRGRVSRLRAETRCREMDRALTEGLNKGRHSVKRAPDGMGGRTLAHTLNPKAFAVLCVEAQVRLPGGRGEGAGG